MGLPIKISLPESFFDEEVRGGYTIDAETKKLWAVELDMLHEFDRVCKLLNLKYFLDSGTLLGAVRHQGFIPWDDDIDVIMLRDDYNKLLEKGLGCFQYPYFLQCAYTDINYYRGHAQLRNSATTCIIKKAGKRPFNQGIFIDIFVLDGFPEDEKKLYKQVKKMNKYMVILQKIANSYLEMNARAYLKIARIAFLELRYGKFKVVYEHFEKVAQQYSDSNYVDKMMFRRDINKMKPLKRDLFEETIYMVFEGMSFPVPANYHEILKVYYGEDYMIPRNSQSRHPYEIWSAERPYTDVVKEADGLSWNN